jgi:D-3-phosphoglycerate dehydrogenase
MGRESPDDPSDPLPRRLAVASHVVARHPVLRSEILARYPDASFNDTGRRLVGAELVALLRGHDAAIVALEIIDAALLDAVPELRVIGKYGVGLDTIDLDALSARGVRLGWTGGVNATAVAELALGLMLGCLRGIPRMSAGLRSGVWQPFRGRLLRNQLVGLIGCGHVGQALGRSLRALGCRVTAHDPRDLGGFYAETGIVPVTLDELLATADIVSLHLPCTARTRGMLGAAELARMRPGAILINTARGGIVDERALAAALRDGRLAAAGFDVFAVEPPVDQDLLAIPDLVATCHAGGSTVESVLACGRSAIAGLTTARDPASSIPEWAR